MHSNKPRIIWPAKTDFATDVKEKEVILKLSNATTHIAGDIFLPTSTVAFPATVGSMTIQKPQRKKATSLDPKILEELQEEAKNI